MVDPGVFRVVKATGTFNFPVHWTVFYTGRDERLRAPPDSSGFFIFFFFFSFSARVCAAGKIVAAWR